MKAKLVKIILITAVIAFFSAGVTMAQDRRGGRQNNVKAKAYSHYKQDKNHKFEHNRQFKNRHQHKDFSKNQRCPYYRPVVIQKYRLNHYRHYRNYRSHTGVAFSLSVFDPNVAFSVGVKGR
jgi:Ni/Co efflux regulator RcnB